MIPLPDFSPSIPRVEWVKGQQGDQSLSSLVTSALPENEMGNGACGYFFQDELLVTKWVPRECDFVNEPVFQVVVSLGHLGVRKTYDRVLHYFFFLAKVEA